MNTPLLKTLSAKPIRHSSFVITPRHGGRPQGLWRGGFGLPFCSRLQLSTSLCAVSSVVEHYLDTVGVTGSNPVPRAIHFSPIHPCRLVRRRKFRLNGFTYGNPVSYTHLRAPETRHDL